MPPRPSATPPDTADAGQEFLDPGPQVALLQVQPLHGASAAAAEGRGPPQVRDQPLNGGAGLLVDVGDGVLRKARLLGDGVGNSPVEERDAEPLGNPRPDDCTARPVKRGECHHRWVLPLVLISPPLPGERLALIDDDRHDVGVGAERRVQPAERHAARPRRAGPEPAGPPRWPARR